LTAPTQQVPIESGARTERRIAWLTLVFGSAASAAAAVAGKRIWASGLLIGAVLAWLNFRWLRRGLDGLVAASAAQAEWRSRAFRWALTLRRCFRYGLIALIVYAILNFFRFPLLAW